MLGSLKENRGETFRLVSESSVVPVVSLAALNCFSSSESVVSEAEGFAPVADAVVGWATALSFCSFTSLLLMLMIAALS